MSGCEPEEVIDLQGDIDDGLAIVDPDVEAWVDDGSGLDDLTSTEVDGFEEPVLDEVEPDDPFVPLEDDGGDPVGVIGDDLVGGPDVGAEDGHATWVDLSDEPVDTPVVYEDGSLVSQVPVADDLVTVESVSETEVYHAWEQAHGGADAPLVEGGAVATGTAFDRPTMVGDSGDVSFWFRQNTLKTCGPTVIAQILNDFTGTAYTDELGLAQEAQADRLFDPNSGMKAEAMATFLDGHGVPSTVVENQDFEDVERYLREGQAVVMFVDAKDVIGPGYEAFAGTDEPENTPLDTVDHFVRVIGIDRAAGIAIISNPGQYGGSQVEIPLDRLEEAWNDNIYDKGAIGPNSHVLVVSDGVDQTPDARPQPVALPQPTPQPAASQTGTPDPGPMSPTGTPDPGPMSPTGTLDPSPSPDPPVGPEPRTVALPSGPGPGPHPTDPSPLAPEPRPVARSVELPAPASGLPSTASTSSGEVELPTSDLGATAPTATPNVEGADRDQDGWLDPVHGLVIIPVALAGARIAMAAKERLAD